MRLLHTADLHLRTDNPESIEALDEILNTARSYDVDLLTIAGDLFDRPEDANALRPELRTRFQDLSYDVFAIPGNHDADAFSRNLEFGRDIEILVDSPCESKEYNGVTIVGVPYTPTFTEDLYDTLYEYRDVDTPTILLIHCTLDIGFGASEVGEEGEIQYCPVQLETLSQLGFDYVLAGHIHSTFHRRALGGGHSFIYPGSPISHSRSETGPRHTAFIDVEAGQIESIPLETHYYDRKRWNITPETETAVLNEIEEWVQRHSENSCDLEVVLDGFIEQSETEFADQLQTVVGPAEVVNQTRQVSHVYSHPLYERFVQKLRQREDVENSDDVEQLFVRSLDSLIASGEIRP